MAMRANRIALFHHTSPLLGGAGDNPYYAWARWGTSSAYGSSFELERDIRHTADGHWGPTRYGGNAIPSMGEWMLDWNPGHPCIEGLYHPKLTHKQKITRLYKKMLQQCTAACSQKNRNPANGIAGVIHGWNWRHIRAEFEKNRYVDEGSAEWLFVRANEYCNGKMDREPVFQYGYPGKMYHSRFNCYNVDSYTMFPHGFDGDEGKKMYNPYHRYGMPWVTDQLLAAHSPTSHALVVHGNFAKHWSAVIGCIFTFWGFCYNLWIISDIKLGFHQKIPGDWAWDAREALDMHVGVQDAEKYGKQGYWAGGDPLFPEGDFLAPRRGGPHLAPF